MPPQVLDAYERTSALEAADAAGAYLDEIGKTDLAKLTLDEWGEFWRRFVTGYEQVMRRKILGHEAPF